MITLRCPTCGLQAQVLASTTRCIATCPHTGTNHDAKPAALMSRIPTPEKVTS